MLNLSDYKEHFCEYILFRYAWANEFVKEPFPENLYENLLKLYDQDEPYLMLVLQDNQQTDQRGLNVFGNAFNGGGLYISYGTYKDNVPAWKTCLLAAKLEMCYRLKEERAWKY